jgi:hypothetical protein
VAFLHRKNHRDGGLTHLILAKQRNGPTGTFRLSLDRDTVTFSPFAGEEPAEREAPKAAKKVKAPKSVTI